MTPTHPQETILETYTYNGIAVDLVKWTPTTWCGTIGYALDNCGEPDVDPIMSGYQSLSFPENAITRMEDGWDTCISTNYLSPERPNGVMFAFLGDVHEKPESVAVQSFPECQFMRVSFHEDVAAAVGRPSWQGGIPPYEWIGDIIAPHFGYTYGADDMPILEYYGNYRLEKGGHEFYYMYVPVKKAD